ncbi:hypothetical protein [Arenimonas sp.]|uniref:hypothetical protein n=1 Tax=Arenimonas sp. TaxID=1872635 RepID=UPI0039E46397
MKCKSLVALLLFAGSLPAFAEDQTLATMQVRAQPVFSVSYACAERAQPSRADVERLLQINDGTQTAGLSHKLADAVGDACKAGVAAIEVRRGAHGRSLSWAPARQGASVAIALR